LSLHVPLGGSAVTGVACSLRVSAEALCKRYEGFGQAVTLQQQQQQQGRSCYPPNKPSAAAKPVHLAALEISMRAAGLPVVPKASTAHNVGSSNPGSHSLEATANRSVDMQQPASSLPTKQADWRTNHRLRKSSPPPKPASPPLGEKGAAVPAFGPTDGLLLPLPQFSSSLFGEG
jgi:hypothetical protein